MTTSIRWVVPQRTMKAPNSQKIHGKGMSLRRRMK